MIRVRVKSGQAVGFLREIPDRAVEAAKQALRLGVTPLAGKVRGLFGNIPKQALRRRLDVRMRPDGKMNLWVGLNPISTAALGKAKKTPSGVSVGGRDYPGAFTLPAKGGAWKRAGKSRYPIFMISEPVEHLTPSILALADGYVEGVLQSLRDIEL